MKNINKQPFYSDACGRAKNIRAYLFILIWKN